ncbi:MAG: hypothetical protein U5N58_08345 [Actinomycetota bacterium]|nr:hypothetical protein [Actinomycetota bacterium]
MMFLTGLYLSGTWEEIWRSLESIEFFDLDQVLAYVLLLEKQDYCCKSRIIS